MIRRPAQRLAALLVAALPLIASCSLDNQTIGSPATPSGGSDFRTYAAIGTNIGAGIQSGGINDSTQREAYTTQLAVAMGLTPNVNWFYPSFAGNGCPAPLTNALTGARVGGTSPACAFRTPSTVRALENNVSIPSLRAAQALNLTNLDFPATDSLKLAQFITGSRNPIDVVEALGPTFITVEVGANDVLGAATRGDITLLTPSASFATTMDALAARLDGTGAKVAIANVPNVTSIPHFTRASILWCLKTGACPGVPATVPFSLGSFSIDNSCAPAAAVPGAIGDTYLLTFSTLGGVVGTLSAGRFASVNCATDQVLLAPAATPTVPSVPAGATITPAELTAINAAVAAFNTKIAAIATAHGYALVDFAALLAAQAANIPPIPSFGTPTKLFGTLFSQDGIHPAKAGQKIIANGFIAAINAKFGTTLTAIP